MRKGPERAREQQQQARPAQRGVVIGVEKEGCAVRTSACVGAPFHTPAFQRFRLMIWHALLCLVAVECMGVSCSQQQPEASMNSTEDKMCSGSSKPHVGEFCCGGGHGNYRSDHGHRDCVQYQGQKNGCVDEYPKSPVYGTSCWQPVPMGQGSCCGPHGRCTDDWPGAARSAVTVPDQDKHACACESGYFWESPDEFALCTDDFCARSGCGAHGRCEGFGLGADGRHCVCRPGWEGDGCGTASNGRCGPSTSLMDSDVCCGGGADNAHKYEAAILGKCLQFDRKTKDCSEQYPSPTGHISCWKVVADAFCCGQGSCNDKNATEVCTCNKDFHGARCEYAGPPQGACIGVDCGKHGVCIDGSDGTCKCDHGYSGDSCQFSPCHDMDCGDHGGCVLTNETGHCVCDMGWLGATCATKAISRCHARGFEFAGNTPQNLACNTASQRVPSGDPDCSEQGYGCKAGLNCCSGECCASGIAPQCNSMGFCRVSGPISDRTLQTPANDYAQYCELCERDTNNGSRVCRNITTETTCAGCLEDPLNSWVVAAECAPEYLEGGASATDQSYEQRGIFECQIHDNTGAWVARHPLLTCRHRPPGLDPSTASTDTRDSKERKELAAWVALAALIAMVGAVVVCLYDSWRGPSGIGCKGFWVWILIAILWVSASIVVVLATIFRDTSRHDEDSGYYFGPMQVACLAVTVGSWLPLPRIVYKFKRTLTRLSSSAPSSLQLSDSGDDTMGFFGFVMFLYGLFDFCRGPLLCYSLALCGSWVLFACCVTSLLVTTATTCHLGYAILGEVALTSVAAKQWLVKHGKLAAMIVLTSSSRIDMICVFRLKLCGRMITNLPMEERHFHFTKHAGMFHYLIEDLPHAFIGIAQLSMGSSHCHSTDNVLNVDEKMVVIVSTVASLISILFGLANKSLQLLMLQSDTIRSTVGMRHSLVGVLNGLRHSLRGSASESLLGAQATNIGGSE